jgi:serine/threonine-protein kinase
VRDSAAQHALAALRAANEARSDTTHAARADALREAARALALDPDNETASEVLSGMLVRPPTVPPPAASRSFEVAERTPAADALRAFGLRAALWAGVIPLGLSLGVRDWRGAALPIAAVALFAGTVLAARVRRSTSRASKLTILATAMLAVATFAGLFGPFIIVPALSATVATAFAMFHGSRDRHLAIALGVAALAVPLALEAFGIVGTSMHVTREGIVLLPRIVWFSPGVTCALLVVANVLAIPVNVIIAGRLRDAVDDGRRKLALHAWQLEHTLPRAVASKASKG